MEASSFKFVTHVQVSLTSTSGLVGTVEVRGAYGYDREETAVVEYVSIFSVGGQVAERVNFKQVGEMAYRRIEHGGDESPWESVPVERPAVSVVGEVSLRSTVAMIAERVGIVPPGAAACGEERIRLLDPDQSGRDDYHVVEVAPETPEADGCASYLVATHWVSLDTLRPWRTAVETRGRDEDAALTGQMVFSEYDSEVAISAPPGFEASER